MSSGKDNPGYEADDKNEKAVVNGAVKHKKDQDHDDYEDPKFHRYGWGSFRPDFLQCCHNPKGYLFFLCVYVFVQGMVGNGLVFVVISTLERRFGFTSTRSGMIVSVYDFAAMCALIFVTYYGDRGSKPRYIGIGAFFFGVGNIVFTLPHFLSEKYNAEGTLYDTCNSTRPTPDRCSGDFEDLSSYYVVFIIAQVIHGLSSTPLYTLGIAYLDENSSPRKGALYLGIFQAVGIFGPALGFILGGVMLNIYVDMEVDPDTLPIDSSSPLWVGAWWLGFLICGCLNIAISIPLLGFGRHLPGRQRKQRQREIETQSGASFNTKPGFGQSLREFPQATWTLLKNLPFMFITLSGATELFIVAYITAFGPKYFEGVFNMTPSSAAILGGVIGLPTGLIANIFTGWLVKSYDLKVPGMLKYMFGCLCLAVVLGLTFLWTCDSVDFAGVTVQYGNTSLEYPKNKYANLTAGCNANCNCERFFDPVCGSDDVMYYTACLAGCKTELELDENGLKQYTDCSCIPPTEDSVLLGTANSGRCEGPCGTLLAFIILFFLATLMTFCLSVPSVTCTLRCVDANQRSFALGLQSLIIRGVGLIPGPIVYGSLIDDTCLIWEQSCSGGWVCWMFDKEHLSYITVMLGLGIRLGSILFIGLAFLFYKPSKPRKANRNTDRKALMMPDDGVSSEQKKPVAESYSSIGVQASFPSGKTRKDGTLESTDL